MNTKVTALLNEKGGVGKSTSATAIAYILAKQENLPFRLRGEVLKIYQNGRI